MTAKKQVPANPFIKPDSPYRCSESDCFERGVWSPGVFGSGWFCAKHAEPLQAEISKAGSPAYLQFCQWWAKFKRNPPHCEHPDQIGSFVRLGAVLAPRPVDFEAAEERRAIQSESDGI